MGIGPSLSNQLLAQSSVNAGRIPTNIPVLVPDNDHPKLPLYDYIKSLDFSQGLDGLVKDPNTGLWSNRTPAIPVNLSPTSKITPSNTRGTIYFTDPYFTNHPIPSLTSNTPAVHIDSSPMGESPPAPKLKLQMPAFGAATMGHQTGEVGKVVAKTVKETIATVQDTWDHWSGHLGDLLTDVKWVWWGMVAVVVTYELYRYTPIFEILEEALKALMGALRSSLKVLGWVWDGFEDLMEELWSVVRRLFGSS